MRFKKENYVSQFETSNGWRFRVRIANKKVDKYFSEKDYGGSRRAYEAAVRYRNECLVTDFVEMEKQKTLAEILNESYDVIPVREETKRKHLIYFQKYFDKQNVVINKITKIDIINSLNKAINESDDTIARIYSVWKRIYKTANIKDYIHYDLSQGVIVPKSQKMEKPPKKLIISRGELNTLFDKIDNAFTKNEAVVVKMALETMWYTGMRPAECFALNISDFKDGFIEINKELGSNMANSDTIGERKQVIRKCKTKASVRKIPISDKLQTLLSGYKPKYKQMFVKPNGDYYDISQLGQKLHRLDKDFNMYQLRHTVATHLIVDLHADERTVTEILGHERINMSVYYARSNQEKKKSVLNCL